MFDSGVNNIDLDGDGIMDAYGEEVDTNADGDVDAVIVEIDGDGIIDMVFEDADSDEYFESVYYDTDGDGVAEAVEVDVDADGVVDASYGDIDGDGQFENVLFTDGNDTVMASDTDGNGMYDTWVVDNDSDGTVNEVHYDENGDGLGDMAVSDTDGDGQFDRVDIDLDGDEYSDVVILDEDGDMEADKVYADTDFDGELDTEYDSMEEFEAAMAAAESEPSVFTEDTDGDGVSDTGIVDLNGDGVADAIAHDANGDGDADELYFDNTGDGIIDQLSVDGDDDGDFETTYYAVDTDDDGIEDSVIIETFVDTDDDGIDDTAFMGVDFGGDGNFEIVDMYGFDAETLEYEYIDTVHYDDSYFDYMDDHDNFDPENSDSDSVVGDPGDSMEEWEFQGDTNRCAVYSQMFVIEDATGEDVDIEELVEIAEENGWFTEEGGTPINCINKILDYYEIENEMSYNNDISDIEEVLANGGQVIVSVDADEIWFGENDNIFDPTDGPNHAVEVIGIDYSNPDEPMVILNDPGDHDGCGVMVPMDVFEDAWEDGNCQMVACE